jgi:Uncharacterized protein conserved in bacteria
MLNKNDVVRVKNDIQNYVGNRVKLQCGHGAHQTTIDNCVVTDIYPDIFTVQLYQNKIPYRKLSYTYIDVMTNNVKVISY